MIRCGTLLLTLLISLTSLSQLRFDKGQVIDISVLNTSPELVKTDDGLAVISIDQNKINVLFLDDALHLLNQQTLHTVFLKDALIVSNAHTISVVHRSEKHPESFQVRQYDIAANTLSDPIFTFSSHHKSNLGFHLKKIYQSDNQIAFRMYHRLMATTEDNLSDAPEFTSDVFVMNATMDQMLWSLPLSYPVYEAKKPNESIREKLVDFADENSILYRYRICEDGPKELQFKLVTKLFHFDGTKVNEVFGDTSDINYEGPETAYRYPHPFVNEHNKVMYYSRHGDLSDNVEGLALFTQSGELVKSYTPDNFPDLMNIGILPFSPEDIWAVRLLRSNLVFGAGIENLRIFSFFLGYLHNGEQYVVSASRLFTHPIDFDSNASAQIHHYAVEGHLYSLGTGTHQDETFTQVVRWNMEE